MVPSKGGHMSMLSWLESTLLEERQALESALAAKHVALLRELSPHLKGIEMRNSKSKEGIGLTPACGSESSKGDLNGRCGQLREEASKVTPPPNCLSEDEATKRSWWTEGDGMESMTLDGTVETNRVACQNNEVVPPSTLSSGGETTLCNNVASNHSGRQQGVHTLVPWAWRRSTSRSKTPLKEILKPELGENAAVHGPFALLNRVVRSAAFESGFALLILGNTLMMAFESQYNGIDTGWKIGYPGSSSSASESWPGAQSFFEVAEWIFGVLFTIELLLKIACYGKQFCCDMWNFIDTIIVISWFLTVAALFPMPIDPMLLRLARLARLLRLLRLIKKIRLFDSLYLMTTAMKGSFSVLFWSVVLLVLVQALLALFLQSLLEEYILDEQNPEVARIQVFKFYGSFARTMLTMFEITLGNWMPPCRALVENVSEWWMLFSLTHKLVIGFSVLSVITSVFIQETFKVATIDDKIMIMTKERARKTHMTKMETLFAKMDENGDGVVDIDEFKHMLSNQELSTWLSAMELDVRDKVQLFHLIDADESGELSIGELVDGISRLKGAARNYDLVQLQNDNKELLKVAQVMQGQLQQIENRLLS